MNLYLILAIVVGLGIFGGSMYQKGRFDEAQKHKTTVLTETVKDQEKLNEIRNNRPDDRALINKLRSGKF